MYMKVQLSQETDDNIFIINFLNCYRVIQDNLEFKHNYIHSLNCNSEYSYIKCIILKSRKCLVQAYEIKLSCSCNIVDRLYHILCQ